MNYSIKKTKMKIREKLQILFHVGKDWKKAVKRWKFLEEKTEKKAVKQFNYLCSLYQSE